MLITNINLAQSIIARYTNFLSLVASAADLTLLEPPALEQNRENAILQRREIKHIHNCIEQNTMVSVNLNLQFLNQMITRATEQIGKENRNADRMLQHPIVMDAITKPNSIQIDVPATQMLQRELRQNEKKDILGSAPTLLRRSLTQLITQAAHPVMVEYPKPAAGVGAEAAARPIVHTSEPVEALPQGTLTDTKTYAEPVQPKELSLLHPIPPNSPTETGSEKPKQKSKQKSVRTSEQKPEQKPERKSVSPPPPPTSASLVYPNEQPPAKPPIQPSAQSPVRPLAQIPVPSSVPQKTPSLLQEQQAVVYHDTGAATQTDTILKPPSLPASQTILEHIKSEAPRMGVTTASAASVFPQLEAPRTNPPHTSEALVYKTEEAEPQPSITSKVILKTPSLSQREETTHHTVPPASTISAKPAARELPQANITLKTPTRRQGMEVVPLTVPPASPISAKPTAEALPQSNIIFRTPKLPQSVETPPHMAVPPVAVQAHTVKNAPSQPDTVISLPNPRKSVMLIGNGQYSMMSGTPFSTEPNQAAMVHPDTAAAEEVASEESIAARLSPFHRATRIYRKGMAPAADAEQQMQAQPSGLSRISQRNDMPVSRVLREEVHPTAQPKSRKSFEQEDDIVDIPTVRRRKRETNEVRQLSENQTTVINASQTGKKTILAEQPPEVSEAELVRITNQVYRTLESRLRNEKMRRGMW